MALEPATLPTPEAEASALEREGDAVGPEDSTTVPEPVSDSAREVGWDVLASLYPEDEHV